jgi:hypothetical protein
MSACAVTQSVTTVVGAGHGVPGTKTALRPHRGVRAPVSEIAASMAASSESKS